VSDIESKLCKLHRPYGIAVPKKLSIKITIITGGDSMNLSLVVEDRTCNYLVFFYYAPIVPLLPSTRNVHFWYISVGILADNIEGSSSSKTPYT